MAPHRRFCLGVQFHPEFKSGPINPAPLFRSFIGASIANRAGRKGHASK